MLVKDMKIYKALRPGEYLIYSNDLFVIIDRLRSIEITAPNIYKKRVCQTNQNCTLSPNIQT